MNKLIKKAILYFFHANIDFPAETVEIRDRKRIYSRYMLLFALPLVTVGSYHVYTGLFSYGVIDIMFAFVFIFFVLAVSRMRTGKSIFRVTLLIVELLIISWLVTASAISFYPSIFVLTLPPFAFFLMGRIEGFVWSVIIGSATIAVFINPGSLISPPYPDDYILRHLIAFFLIFLFSYNYEAIRERYKNAMEAEQKKLALEKERLASAKNSVEAINRRLQEEMNIRMQAENELREHRDNLEEQVAKRTAEIKANAVKLAASEKRFRLLADNVNDLIWAIDLDFKCTYVTPSVKSLYGYSVGEAMEMTLKQFCTPASRELILNEFRKLLEIENTGTADPNRYAEFQLEQIRKDGSLFDVEMKISIIRDEGNSPIGIAGVTRDITERMQHQREKEKIDVHLAQVQKQDALGTLVGGLAHDFNNLLTGITGSFNLLELMFRTMEHQDREKINQYLGIGTDAARRSAELIKQLLALSKKHNIILSPIDVNESIRYILHLCRNSFPKSIELDFHFSSEPLTIMGDMVQIEQVLLNLCINASHAMTIMREPGVKQGGVLSLHAEKIENDSAINWISPETLKGVKSWVRIQVTDTGVGMDQETRLRIFEPFFTLKQTNEGSGLGLSISYNIILKHGGHIAVSSEPGGGSRFSLYFPFYKSEGDIVSRDNPADEIIRGSGTVLVIDDERLVLNTSKGFLEQSGYDVLIAEGAMQGIAMFREMHSHISAVIIDLSMPVMSGLDVFRELKSIDGNVRAVLTSGMLDNESKEMAFSIGIKDIINKPYLPGELSGKISAVIRGV